MRMKKFLIFITLVIAMFSFTSCSWFDAPANARRVGSGFVQADKGLLFVEVDGVKYHPERVFTNTVGRHGAQRMDPVVGMQITVFYTSSYDTPRFIAGDKSEEYLEEFFSHNYTFPVACGIVILVLFIALIWEAREKTR